jgi:hypothetical protein
MVEASRMRVSEYDRYEHQEDSLYLTPVALKNV